jgi:hypothetical protein
LIRIKCPAVSNGIQGAANTGWSTVQLMIVRRPRIVGFKSL